MAPFIGTPEKNSSCLLKAAQINPTGFERVPLAVAVSLLREMCVKGEGWNPPERSKAKPHVPPRPSLEMFLASAPKFPNMSFTKATPLHSHGQEARAGAKKRASAGRREFCLRNHGRRPGEADESHPGQRRLCCDSCLGRIRALVDIGWNNLRSWAWLFCFFSLGVASYYQMTAPFGSWPSLQHVKYGLNHKLGLLICLAHQASLSRSAMPQFQGSLCDRQGK